MYNIYAPNKRYTGIVAGVSFVNGVGETDNEYLVGWFKEKGYNPEKQEVEEVEDTAATSDDKTIREELDDLTVVELRELASASSIEGYSNMKKDELIQAIESLE